MAEYTASAVLQLPHHGRPGDLLRRPDGRRRIPALAGKALHGALGALADPAQLPAAVYCEHCRLDDCRDRSPALARLRTAPHVGGLLETHRRRHQPIHSAGFPWPVYRALYSLDRARLHHDSEGSEPGSSNGFRAFPYDGIGGTHVCTLSFCIMAVMLTAYVVLDGFDLTVG